MNPRTSRRSPLIIDISSIISTLACRTCRTIYCFFKAWKKKNRSKWKKLNTTRQKDKKKAVQQDYGIKTYWDKMDWKKNPIKGGVKTEKIEFLILTHFIVSALSTLPLSSSPIIDIPEIVGRGNKKLGTKRKGVHAWVFVYVCVFESRCVCF